MAGPSSPALTKAWHGTLREQVDAEAHEDDLAAKCNPVTVHGMLEDYRARPRPDCGR